MKMPRQNSLTLNPDFRNFWGSYDAAAIDFNSLVEGERCYTSRLYKAPDTAQESIAAPSATASGYLKYALEIPPGSFIYAIRHSVPGPTLPDTNNFLVQVTDVGLNHRFFSTPIPDFLLATGALNNNEPVEPWLMPGLHPVVSPGRFLVEFWNVGTTTIRCQIVLCCAVIDAELEEKIRHGE